MRSPVSVLALQMLMSLHMEASIMMSKADFACKFERMPDCHVRWCAGLSRQPYVSGYVWRAQDATDVPLFLEHGYHLARTKCVCVCVCLWHLHVSHIHTVTVFPGGVRDRSCLIHASHIPACLWNAAIHVSHIRRVFHRELMLLKRTVSEQVRFVKYLMKPN